MTLLTLVTLVAPFVIALVTAFCLFEAPDDEPEARPNYTRILELERELEIGPWNRA